MTMSTIIKLSAVAYLAAMAALASCVEEIPMNCEHQIMREIQSNIVIGWTREQVEMFLRKMGADFTYHDHDELILSRDQDANSLEAKIVIIAALPAVENSKLIHGTELMTIGFGQSGRVQLLHCKKIYTGP